APIALLLNEARGRLRLEAFKLDTQLRREAPGLAVTLAMAASMHPSDFERLLGMVYETQGFSVTITGKTGDQGADLILERAGERTIVQAKRYQENVGNSAVQEAFTAKAFYSCHHAIVVTTSDFTNPAREVAGKVNVTLVNGAQLEQLLVAFNSAPKDYARLALLFSRASSAPAPTGTSLRS